MAALLAVACTQKENPVEERIPVALTYETVQATETRALQGLNETGFASGETVTVRISNTGANQWTDYVFTTAADGTMTPPDPAPYYPAGAQNIDIVAYYPSSAGASFTVASDQTADADYKASDLMFASAPNQAKQEAAVTLTFSHRMAKINVNVTAGSGVGSITGVSLLNVLPTVTFDQATGAVGAASGTAASIAMSNDGAAVIPAQTIDGGLLSIVTDKGTATYTVSNKSFEAGKYYTLNITVNLRAIGATNAITGWTTEGTVTVYAERPNIAGHEYVDMGEVTVNGQSKHLLWATCNVGALDPWNYGDYFAWGATSPYYTAGHAEDDNCANWSYGKSSGYSWESYPFMEAGQARPDYITKYNSSDGKTSFADDEYADDAARQRWGSTWRTPLHEEWSALRDGSNFSWEWKTDYQGTGTQGMLVTRLNGSSKGNSIFLPAAGYRGNVNLYRGSYSGDFFNLTLEPYGYYWSASLRNDNLSGALYNAKCVSIRSEGVFGGDMSRIDGLPVRPVTDCP